MTDTLDPQEIPNWRAKLEDGWYAARLRHDWADEPEWMVMHLHNENTPQADFKAAFWGLHVGIRYSYNGYKYPLDQWHGWSIHTLTKPEHIALATRLKMGIYT